MQKFWRGSNAMTRTFFYYASVMTPGLQPVVSSGIFISNVHPSERLFFNELTKAIAGEFAWGPQASDVIVKNLNVLCEDR